MLALKPYRCLKHMLTKVTPTRECAVCFENVSQYRECKVCTRGIWCASCALQWEKKACIVCRHFDTEFRDTRLCIDTRKCVSQCIKKYYFKTFVAFTIVVLIVLIGFCTNYLLKRSDANVLTHFFTGFALIVIVGASVKILVFLYDIGADICTVIKPHCCNHKKKRVFSNVIFGSNLTV